MDNIPLRFPAVSYFGPSPHSSLAVRIPACHGTGVHQKTSRIQQIISLLRVSAGAARCTRRTTWGI